MLKANSSRARMITFFIYAFYRQQAAGASKLRDGKRRGMRGSKPEARVVI
jgi:hypothetical protein